MLAFQNGWAKCRKPAEDLEIVDPLDGEDAASEKVYQWLLAQIDKDEPEVIETPETLDIEG